MSEMLVTDRGGAEHRIIARPDATLMEALRDADLGIAAVCGGMLSCGTCHVYLQAGETRGIVSASEDEAALAASLRHHIEGRSRIASQIPLSGVPPGLRVTIAPEE